ncbi:MAG: hypothetical protein FWH14_02505 [Oscillospiraceae bacterium]|nr:hypothetical protein [Oscillospiraceae bacterium]
MANTRNKVAIVFDGVVCYNCPSPLCVPCHHSMTERATGEKNILFFVFILTMGIKGV